MRRKTLSVVLGVLLVAAGSASLQGADTTGRWIHVRVMDRGEKGETVRVNLPVSVLETMASSIEAEHMKEGRIQLGDSGLKAEDLRAMWQSIRSSRDMEFVTVESGDETVRVAKSGEFLLAKVHDGQGGDKDGERVEVKVPIKVVDALLDAPEGQLNFKAALQALASHDAGDLVQVRDGSSHVRIWIDSRADPQD
jgi:hypothetical protein